MLNDSLGDIQPPNDFQPLFDIVRKSQHDQAASKNSNASSVETPVFNQSIEVDWRIENQENDGSEDSSQRSNNRDEVV